MGVYIPPCSNVESSVNICIGNVATVCTTEVLAVPNANMTAFMASLRSICRWNGGDLNAIYLTLVFKEGPELIEVPRITYPAERLATLLGVHTPSDILQVLNGNGLVFFLCFRYDLFTYAVIDNSGKPSFTSFQPFQQPVTVTCAFGLNRSSHFVVPVSYVLDLIRGNVSTVRDGYNVRNAHIDTDKVLCVLLLLIGNIYRLVEVELSFDKNKVCFSFRMLHELRTVAGKRDFLTTTNKRNGTYRLGDVIGKHTTIISDSTKLPKVPLLFSAEFVCICNLADCTHNELRRKMTGFFNRIIDFLMQAELLENMTFPRYLRDSVASLIENAESIFQCYSLFVSWKQFNLQSQFHTTKIQKSFELFKYLKEIIMLSSLKEGIVAQFLPKAKDFWVSMSQVI